MSTILKALRRLEEQRTHTEGRPLREEVATGPPGAAPARRRVVRWVAAVAVVIAVGVVSGLALERWVRGDSAEPVDVAAQPAPAAAPERAGPGAFGNAPLKQGRPPRARPRPAGAPPAPAPAFGAQPDPARQAMPGRADDPAAAGLPEQAFASQVEVVPRPPAEPRSPMRIARASDPLPAGSAAETPAPPVPPPAPAVPARAPEVAKAAPAPAPAPKVTSEPTPKPAAAPTPERIAAAEPEPVAPAPKPVAAAEPGEMPPPVVDAEPEEFTARATGSSEPPAPEPRSEPAAESEKPPREIAPGASTLLVAKTQWHPLPERRVAFVSIDGAAPRRIQEGDVVGRFVVSEIQPSGVVFLDDGEKVRRAVGAK